MEDRQDITVPMPESMVKEIGAQLDYGDSRAEWIREAIREKLDAEEAEEGNRTPTPTPA